MATVRVAPWMRDTAIDLVHFGGNWIRQSSLFCRAGFSDHALPGGGIGALYPDIPEVPSEALPLSHFPREEEGRLECVREQFKADKSLLGGTLRRVASFSAGTMAPTSFILRYA